MYKRMVVEQIATIIISTLVLVQCYVIYNHAIHRPGCHLETRVSLKHVLISEYPAIFYPDVFSSLVPHALLMLR